VDLDSADWQRQWTIDAGTLVLQPVTRDVAATIRHGGTLTLEFEDGALHDRIGNAMDFAIRDRESGAAAVLPTVWLAVRHADRRIAGDLCIHGPPDRDGSVEIGYSFAPSVRGQGIGSAAVGALVERLSSVESLRRITAVTGADNVPSRRLLERLGFKVTDQLPDSGEVGYALTVG
jgi:RimJ/RimL family protein N-acetyltransferase